MKKIFLFAFLAIVSTSIIAQENIQPLAIGSSMPLADRKMKGTDGKEYALNSMMGKNGLLVMFSCNTCPYVIRYQERTKAIAKAAQDKGFGVIIINSNEGYRTDEDSYEAMMAYAKNQDYTAPYVVDNGSALANAFGATRTPELFLFNNQNKLVYHGAIDDNHIAAEAKRAHAKIALEEVANGKEVTVKDTRSVGCTIKRVKG